MQRAVRYWDKAGTEGKGDYTAGVLMLTCENLFLVADVVRGRWSAWDREKVIVRTAQADARRFGSRLEIWIEQEPGSGGKESAEATTRMLAGYRIRSERPTGSKVTRADPFAAQAEGGHVRLLRADWNEAYLDELIHFPYGAHDDQVDASAGAFHKLARSKPAFEVWVQ